MPGSTHVTPEIFLDRLRLLGNCLFEVRGVFNFEVCYILPLNLVDLWELCGIGSWCCYLARALSIPIFLFFFTLLSFTLYSEL